MPNIEDLNEVFFKCPYCRKMCVMRRTEDDSAAVAHQPPVCRAFHNPDRDAVLKACLAEIDNQEYNVL